MEEYNWTEDIETLIEIITQKLNGEVLSTSTYKEAMDSLDNLAAHIENLEDKNGKS